MLKAIIVDDETHGQKVLQLLLQEYCANEVEVVAFASDVVVGFSVINKYAPDVVFLDIEMPNYSGFSLVEGFENPPFEVIFTTAYEEHALRAFKASAIAYLLKPIDGDELVHAIAKVKKKRALLPLLKERDTLFNSSPNSLKRLAFPSKSSLLYLNLDEILYLQSEEKNTRLFLVDGTSVLSTNSLKECEQLLEEVAFLRIHRSYIVNLYQVKRYSKAEGGFIIMNNNKQLSVGRKDFKDTLNKVVSFFVK